jgi:hypothetical protein
MISTKDIKNRILCNSVLIDQNNKKNENCVFGRKCLYAHRLDEQKIDNFNYDVINRITSESDLSNLSLSDSKTSKIYKKIYFLTNLCGSCIDRKCPGGFNCKFGANIKDILICKDDFLYGKCDNDVSMYNYSNTIKKLFPNNTLKYYGCENGHHLTNKKLSPYNKQYYEILEILNYEYSSDSDDEVGSEINIEIIDYQPKKIYKRIENEITGIRLLHHSLDNVNFVNINTIDYDDDSDSDNITKLEIIDEND